MALVGCGDDGESFDAVAELDPVVTAFCMGCDPSVDEDYLNYCRALYLYYAQTYITLSDDPAGCQAAWVSYFSCVAECDTYCEEEYQQLGEQCSAWGTL